MIRRDMRTWKVYSVTCALHCELLCPSNWTLTEVWRSSFCFQIYHYLFMWPWTECATSRLLFLYCYRGDRSSCLYSLKAVRVFLLQTGWWSESAALEHSGIPVQWGHVPPGNTNNTGWHLRDLRLQSCPGCILWWESKKRKVYSCSENSLYIYKVEAYFVDWFCLVFFPLKLSSLLKYHFKCISLTALFVCFLFWRLGTSFAGL